MNTDLWIVSRKDQLVGAFFVVALLVTEAAFFTLVALLVREATVAFFVLPRVVWVVVFFAFVDVLPFVAGVWECKDASSVVVTFLRVLLRVDAPFCSGLSPTTSC